MDGLNQLIDAVESKIAELEGGTFVQSSSSIKASRPISKLASYAYSPKQIAKNAQEGTRKGETMEYIFKKIMNDPDIEIGDPDKRGDQVIYYKGEDIGWLNPNRGIGWIDPKAYDKLAPYVEPEDFDDSIMSANRITASKWDITSESQLKKAIKAELTEELCEDIVNLAFSSDGDFDQDVFIEADDFFETSLVDDEAKDIALKFFNGEDLDLKGSANPNRDYFRFDGYGNIESTDNPGEIYSEQLDGEIVDYILDHVDDRDFPEEIQSLVDEYLNSKED